MIAKLERRNKHLVRDQSSRVQILESSTTAYTDLQVSKNSLDASNTQIQNHICTLEHNTPAPRPHAGAENFSRRNASSSDLVGDIDARHDHGADLLMAAVVLLLLQRYHQPHYNSIVSQVQILKRVKTSSKCISIERLQKRHNICII